MVSMTLREVLVFGGVAYLVVGILWMLRNHGSTMARMDRQEWRRQGKTWKLVVVPAIVVLVWPLAVLLYWRIKQAMKSGEFDRVAKQVREEWEREGKIKNGHIVGMHDDPHERKDS